MAKVLNDANTFELVALEWYEQQKSQWSESYVKRALWLLTKNLIPWLGRRPIADITPHELLAALRRTEAKGTYV